MWSTTRRSPQRFPESVISIQPAAEPPPAVPEDGSPREIRRFGLDRIHWPNFLAIAALHVLCVFAPATFSWSALLVAVALYWVICGFGISMGYHRLLTHRGFRTSRAFRYFLTVMGTMNFQGGPIQWVGIHRIHHRDSDKDEDPHSPQHGFLWAHLLWCCAHDPLGRDVTQAALDLKKDRAMVWLDKWFFVPQLVLGVILYFLGGWSWVIWGVAVRTVFTYHATWLVNSASHLWGYRNFATSDHSRNNWWVALISFGEGWHNNHHAHQRSARHGMRWFEIDPTWMALCVLRWMHVVSDVYAVKVPAERGR